MKLKINDKIIRFLYNFVDVEASGEAGAPHERLYEYGFALSRILKDGDFGKRVLDVGCVARMNSIPSTLCELGFQVYGIDGRNFLFSHPNFIFRNGDIRQTDFADNFFDVVSIISTIEHIGLKGRYDITSSDNEGDYKTMKEIRRILKPRGKLILTTEVGNPKRSNKLSKVYSAEEIPSLLKGFEIIEGIFYIKSKGRWVKNGTGEGIICVEASKI